MLRTFASEVHRRHLAGLEGEVSVEEARILKESSTISSRSDIVLRNAFRSGII